MRISAIDHLRGIFICLAIIFSLWHSLCTPDPSYSLFFHLIPQKFQPGDLIFPVFLFSSGASLWLYLHKLKQSNGRLVTAEKKYLNLLLIGIFFAGVKLFLVFPDEVTIIALLGLISINIFWSFGFFGIYIVAAILSISLLLLWLLFPSIPLSYSFRMLGGELGFAYFAIIYLVGFVISGFAFPSSTSNFESVKKLSYSLLALAFISFFFSLLWPIDRTSLSPSFLAFSLSVSIFILTLLVLLCDIFDVKFGFFELLGQNSIWGWGLISIFQSSSLFFDFQTAMSVWLYLICCAILLLLLYGAVAIFGRKKS
ncbi:MAG: hypothetical protein QXN37_00745 [Candidatus Anstonellaceae archaeon]